MERPPYDIMDPNDNRREVAWNFIDDMLGTMKRTEREKREKEAGQVDFFAVSLEQNSEG